MWGRLSVIKRIWHDPVGSKVISAGVIAALAGVGGNLRFHWWSWAGLLGWFRIARQATWAFIFASTPFPHWLVGLSCLVVVAIPILIVAAASPSNRLISLPEFARTQAPAWHSYTSDVFHGVRWRWGYDHTGQLTEPTCYCPKCDCQLVIHNIPDRFTGDHRTAFHCVGCNRDIREVDKPVDYVIGTVGVFIDKNIRNKTWPTAVAASPNSNADNPR